MSFLYPLALLGIPIGTGILLVIYRRVSSGEPTEVPTLFLLSHFISEGGKPRRFFPPLRFLFELLMLLLLSLAAAGFSFLGSGGRAILVIDNRFQTSAITRESSTIFETVVERAKEALRTNLEKDSVLVMVTTPRLAPVTDGFVSSASAATTLASIKPAYGAGEIKMKLPSLLSREDTDKIVISSPSPIEQSVTDRTRVILLPVGLTPLSNVAVEKMWVDPTKEVSVKLRAFSEEKISVTVGLSLISSDGSKRSTERREIVVEPNTSSTLTFPPPSGEGIGYFARIESPEIGPDNSLRADDESWLSMGRPASTIGVVSHLSAKQLGLDRVLGGALEEISPTQIEENPPRVAGWIFHRLSPQRPKTKPSLYILPPPDAPLIRSAPFSAPWSVAIWEGASPLFRYLSPDTILGVGGAVLETGGAFSPLLRGDQGSIIAEGFPYGTHTVVMGCEALPFLGAGNPSLSILLLNTINHLFPNATAGELSPYSLLPRTEVGEKPRYLAYSSELPVVADPHTLSVPGLIAIPSMDGPDDVRAITFFDESESNLFGQRAISISTSETMISPKENRAINSTIPSIITILLGLMCIDGALAIRSRSNIKRGRA